MSTTLTTSFSPNDSAGTKCAPVCSATFTKPLLRESNSSTFLASPKLRCTACKFPCLEGANAHYVLCNRRYCGIWVTLKPQRLLGWASEQSMPPNPLHDLACEDSACIQALRFDLFTQHSCRHNALRYALSSWMARQPRHDFPFCPCVAIQGQVYSRVTNRPLETQLAIALGYAVPRVTSANYPASAPLVEYHVVGARTRQHGLLCATQCKQHCTSRFAERCTQCGGAHIHKSQEQHQLSRNRRHKVPVQCGCAHPCTTSRCCQVHELGLLHGCILHGECILACRSRLHNLLIIRIAQLQDRLASLSVSDFPGSRLHMMGGFSMVASTSWLRLDSKLSLLFHALRLGCVQAMGQRAIAWKPQCIKLFKPCAGCMDTCFALPCCSAGTAASNPEPTYCQVCVLSPVEDTAAGTGLEASIHDDMLSGHLGERQCWGRGAKSPRHHLQM